MSDRLAEALRQTSQVDQPLSRSGPTGFDSLEASGALPEILSQGSLSAQCRPGDGNANDRTGDRFRSLGRRPITVAGLQTGHMAQVPAYFPSR